MELDEMVEVTAFLFDTDGKWLKTAQLTRPVYLAHTSSQEVYLGMWQRRNGPLKRNQYLVVLNPSGGGPMPILIQYTLEVMKNDDTVTDGEGGRANSSA